MSPGTLEARGRSAKPCSHNNLSDAHALGIDFYLAPLHLFAHHTALYRGANVDQPRNLAKSVTVE